MKRRIISLLLMLCLTVSLFTGMTMSAYADEAETISYTMKEGDTVYNVCKRLGIDFYANYDFITAVNKITSYSHISIGKVITLPKPGTVITASAASAASAGTGSGTASGSGTAAVAGTSGSGAAAVTTGAAVSGGNGSSAAVSSTAVKSGDSIAYYLVPYTLQSGDTIYNLCSTMGVSYAAYSDIIMKLNGLKSLSNVKSGRTILMPTSKVPSSGSCYTVIAHQMGSGDTAYNLCGSYGINYYESLSMLQAVNKKDNLALVYAGQAIYLPVPSVIKAGGGSVSGGGTSGTVAPAPNADGSLGITKVSTANGSFMVLNGGNQVSSAKKGDKLSVVATPDNGYKAFVKVFKTGDNSTTVSVAGDNTFTMPEYAVTVEVTFGAQYKISTNSPINGDYTVKVNGNKASTAYAGQKVVLDVDPKDGYGTTVKVVKADETSVEVPVTDNCFVMPAYNVKVTVKFQKGSYSISCVETDKGSISVTNGTKVISSAKKDDTVDLDITANAGYTVSAVKVYKTGSTGTKTTVTYAGSEKWQFTMPGYDVTVDVTFKAQTSGVNVSVDPSAGGSATVVTNIGKEGSSFTAIETGTVLTVNPKPADGYKLDYIEVKYTNANGNSKTISVGEDCVFTMPACKSGTAATVYVYFETASYTITSAETTNGSFTVSVDHAVCSAANTGDTVRVVSTPAAGYAVDKITVTKTGGKTPYKTLTNADETFTMPGYDVTIAATFKATGNGAKAVAGTGGTATLTVAGKTLSAFTAITTGSSVQVNPKPNDGYVLDYIEVNYKDVNNNSKSIDVDKNNCFEMPACTGEATVNVYFKTASLTITKAKTTNGSFAVRVNGAEGTAAATGDTVRIISAPAAGYTVEKVVVSKTGGNQVIKTMTVDDDTFTMPAFNVTVTASFKVASDNKIDYKATEMGNSYVIKVDGATKATVTDTESSITGIKTGASVEIVPSAAAGYTLDYITVYSGATTVATGTSFKMPAGDVTIEVHFKTNTYKLTASSAKHGSVRITDESGSNMSTAQKGTVFKVEAIADFGYTVDAASVVVKNASTKAVIAPDATGALVNGVLCRYTMPAADVTVEVTFKAAKHKIDIVYYTDGTANDSTGGTLKLCKDKLGNTNLANGVTTVNDLSTDATLYLDPTIASGYKYVECILEYKDANGVTQSRRFAPENGHNWAQMIMRGSDCTLKVYFVKK